MVRRLTSKERTKLIISHRKERDKRICDRIKAVLAYDDGYSYSEIANILLLDDETIRRHIDEYFKENKLAPENGGSDSHLSKRQSLELVAHLMHKTYLYVKDICDYVRKAYKISYSISGMTKWLRSNNFRYKKPTGVPGKCDKNQQKNFIKYYEELKDNLKDEEVIYFVDSVHPEHQTKLAYGWIKKGERKKIQMSNKQYRINIMGGICLKNHKVVYEKADKIDEMSIQSFLYRLRKHHPGKYFVHVIWDNAGYHCSKQVIEFANELGIKLHYLPPYSPNLNPIERLWKIMHENVTYNRYYEKFNNFTEAILYFFRHIGKKKRVLRSRITDNFQLIDLPNFAS